MSLPDGVYCYKARPEIVYLVRGQQAFFIKNKEIGRDEGNYGFSEGGWKRIYEFKKYQNICNKRQKHMQQKTKNRLLGLVILLIDLAYLYVVC